MLHFTPRDLGRFMRYVVKLPGRLILPDGRETSACWLWMGGRSRGKGNRSWYGSFRLGTRSVRAHRFACEALAWIECPPDHHRDHLCCNSLCVNPEHLEVVHKVENQRRKMERRSETHAKRCGTDARSVGTSVGDPSRQAPRQANDPRQVRPDTVPRPQAGGQRTSMGQHESLHPPCD